jgi:soluble lytic murein transglycosylase
MLQTMWVRRSLCTSIAVAILLGLPGGVAPGFESILQADASRPTLRPTAHPRVPRDRETLWLVPPGTRPGTVPKSGPLAQLAAGVDLIAQERFADALPRVKQPALAKTPLADYAEYYTALAHLRTGDPASARERFRRLNQANVPGVIGEWALLGEARAAEQESAFAEAARLFEKALERKPEKPDEVLAGLARNQIAAGARDKALATYRQLYFGFPSSAQSEMARQQLATLSGVDESERLKRDFAQELGRAERLFGMRRYAEALSEFESVSALASGDEGEKVQLRIAECAFYLGRYRQTLDGVRPYIDRASRKVEARFFAASAQRELGEHDAYVAEARKLVAEFPDSPWAEDTLNNLATHYILVDDDPTAAEVFAQYLEKFPRGRYAPRAAWKLGWWRFRQGDNEAAVAIFERAAANFPRSDYRPAWLYWTARAYERLNVLDLAAARHALVVIDYLNSYYGRLSDEQLRRRDIGAAQRSALLRADELPSTPADPASTSDSSNATLADSGLPVTARRIRQLIAAGLYTTAGDEVRHAQRTSGSAPALEATLAWLYQAQGDFRAGINAMKRAYPQYLSEDGRLLPNEALRVIFPLEYWSLIRKHASARGLDPYLVAALVAQESSFDPDVRSSANAYGLMQIVPSTGKRLARSLGIRRFSTRSLTNPETNVRLGTLYFKNLVSQFGGTHYALASYNAGESKVQRWINERGELPQEEFIDDIPYPETQNYVKKILGTAEDYRRLYGAPERRGTGAGE